MCVQAELHQRWPLVCFPNGVLTSTDNWFLHFSTPESFLPDSDTSTYTEYSPYIERIGKAHKHHHNISNYFELKLLSN